jgi:hypothetical protein
MKVKIRHIFWVSTLLLAISTQAVAEQQVKIGWLENVIIGDNGATVAAKIDTGADNSSLNARNPEFYMKQGVEWVKFSLITMSVKSIHIDKPIEHRTRIKTKDKGSQQRVVINMEICLGTIKKQVHVNLVNRGHFKYQMLIGRSYLVPEFLVDSGKTFTVEPDC